MAWVDKDKEQSLLRNEVVPGLPVGGPPLQQQLFEPELIWEGTTWQACPCCCMFLAPLCCSSWHWKITTARIDWTHGCCGSDMDTLDMRRIVDLHFHRSCGQLLCCRGTIAIHSDNDEFPTISITTFNARDLYEQLREAWTRARIATAVNAELDHADHGHHH